MAPIIHWFRRDLRLHDNPALLSALRESGGAVIPLFIVDETILRLPRTGAARTTFLFDSLRVLDESLRAQGSRLVVRRGQPLEVLPRLLDDTGAQAVFFNRDYTPHARRRDQQIATALNERGTRVTSFKDVMIWEADEIRTKTGSTYTVYTPYARQWRARVEQHRAQLMTEEQLPAFAPVAPDVDSMTIPEPAEFGLHTTQTIPPGGELAGRERLAAFTRLTNGDGIGGYDQQRDYPAHLATSRLSPYLRLGCVAPQACLRAALSAIERTGDAAKQRGAETWIGELAWRDFYYQILDQFPHVLRGAFKREYDGLEWENNAALFDAWCEGRTGYPIVDAAMRQMNREAWMHNRARMIVASFLSKDLLIDWRKGELYFMQRLVDGDHASNNGGWQWAAGTGTDAQPYFRIFNPVTQSEKFDSRGEYIRRYIPELAPVPDRYIHAPWTMPPDEQRRIGVVIGTHYPGPIVDHAIQRQRALALYKATRAERTD